MSEKDVSVITELLLMREALRDRLINVVLGSGINLIVVLSPFFRMPKNKVLKKFTSLIYALVLYTATKPLRMITEVIKELDITIETLIYELE